MTNPSSTKFPFAHFHQTQRSSWKILTTHNILSLRLRAVLITSIQMVWMKKHLRNTKFWYIR